MIFHAVVSTTVTIIVIRSLWPERVSESFLEKKHYVVLGALLAVAIVTTNVVFVPLLAKSMGYSPPFEPLPFFLLLLISLFFVFLIKKSLAQKPVFGARSASFPSVVYVLLGAAIFTLAFVASHVALAFLGPWFAGAIIILSGYLFHRYLRT